VDGEEATMNRNGGVIALTVVGVLVAGGIAAALNTVVLHGSTQASVGSAEQLLAAGLSPLDPSPSSTSSTASAEPTATPVGSEESTSTSEAPAPSSSHAVVSAARGGSTPQVTRTSTRHSTIAHVASSPRPSPSPTEDHGGSNGGSGKSDSGSPSSGSGSGGGGSDD
jgi:hypothetical protein